jgi:hypothetical protein
LIHYVALTSFDADMTEEEELATLNLCLNILNDGIVRSRDQAGLEKLIAMRIAIYDSLGETDSSARDQNILTAINRGVLGRVD